GWFNKPAEVSMKCPFGNATPVMADGNGIEIDYCSECRGVWPDLGKFIQRLVPAAPPPQARHQ
ncbi:MAG: zf-TFIIB domain-containing protein, partial [Pseudomonadota bacterium]